MRKVLFVCLVALLVLGAQADRSLLKKKRKKKTGAGGVIALVSNGVVNPDVATTFASPSEVDPQLLTNQGPAANPLFYAGIAYDGSVPPVAIGQVTAVSWTSAILAMSSIWVQATQKWIVPTTLVFNTLSGAVGSGSQSRTVTPTNVLVDVTTGIVVLTWNVPLGVSLSDNRIAPVALPADCLGTPVTNPSRLAPGQVVTLAAFNPVSPGPPPTYTLTNAIVAAVGYVPSTYSTTPGLFQAGNVIGSPGPVVNTFDKGSIAIKYGGGGARDLLLGLYDNASKTAPTAGNGYIADVFSYLDLTDCYVRFVLACNGAAITWSGTTCAASCAGFNPIYASLNNCPRPVAPGPTN